MKNKNGFTLAEIIISITIIGVLAAILLPMLNKYAPDKNKIMFRKGYYTIERAVSEIANDETHYPTGTTGCAISGIPVECLFHNKNLTPDIPAENDKFCYLLSNFLNTIGDVNCTQDYVDLTQGNTYYWSFKTTDGIKWRVGTMDYSDPFPISTTPTLWIFFDVNGEKEPNCLNKASELSAILDPELSCAADFKVAKTDIHGVKVRYDGKIVLDNTDTFETEALSDPTKFTK